MVNLRAICAQQYDSVRACTQCSCIACPARVTILSFFPCNSHAHTLCTTLKTISLVQDNMLDMAHPFFVVVLFG
jgi:hypothetical protein